MIRGRQRDQKDPYPPYTCLIIFSLVIDVLVVSPSDGTSQFDDATLKGNNNNQNKHNLFNEVWSSSQLGLRNPFKRGTQKDLYRLVIV